MMAFFIDYFINYLITLNVIRFEAYNHFMSSL